MKKTGVVLVCYHSQEETLSCAMMYAEMSCINHIVIVDNEATENSRAFFETNKNSKMEVIYQDHNLGYSKGNNIGIRHLIQHHGVDKIIISNSDVSIEENAILQCMEILRAEDSLGAIAPQMKGSDGAINPLRHVDLGYLRILLRVLIPEKAIDQFTQGQCEKKGNITYQSFLPGSFFVIKREAVEKCEGFDENIFLYREEEILGKRLSRAGYRNAVCTECFYIHNHNYKTESAEIKIRRNRFLMKSERVFFRNYINSNHLVMPKRNLD